ncbi:MAG: hypothetical protein GC150_01715 [Rhizobiales bacterium]|nr:hypothetical protein [Hyphomicrobiales bacterium]
MSAMAAPCPGLLYGQRFIGAAGDAVGAHGSAGGEARLRTLAERVGLTVSEGAGWPASGAGEPRGADGNLAVAGAYGRLAEGAGTIVFVGDGELATLAKVVAGFTGWNVPGERIEGQLQRPRVRFLDRADARALEALLVGADMERLRFVLLAGNEDTPGTRLMGVGLIEALRQGGLAESLGDRVLVIAGPGAGTGGGSHTMARTLGLAMLAHPAGVPDLRAAFSTTTEFVGLARGLDVANWRAGARDVLALLHAQVEDAAPATGTRFVAGGDGGPHEVASRHGHLVPLASWWELALARSAPARAWGFGTRTQLVLEDTLCGPCIESDLLRASGLVAPAGRPLGEALGALSEREMTRGALEGRRQRVITCRRLDPRGLGQVMMHVVAESILLEAGSDRQA